MLANLLSEEEVWICGCISWVFDLEVGLNAIRRYIYIATKFGPVDVSFGGLWMGYVIAIVI